ncbi:DUF2855 family protein [Maricaulis sp.]|uniref:DUF2855 family protein n=1 Tax=Maricaulis sp. TaxID=1486257 RepID=UPI002639715D|nr:DUF2855 family protein [Maricaulis sp.]
MGWSLSIDMDDIADATVVTAKSGPLPDGAARLRIDRFALTANNVTYAAFGRAMRYWDFFPGDDGRGRLPVWGFAEVSESRVDGLAPGERVYGYFPAASELDVQPVRITASGFADSSAHRTDLPPAYNAYVRCQADPAWSPEIEAAQMVLQPLFVTAFLLDNYLRDDANGLDAARILLTSASSKTAISLAYLLKQAGRPAHALTSARNAGFVAGLELYDGVTTYDALGSLGAGAPAVIVDFAGDADINRGLHTHLADALLANIRVGGAHWERSAPPKDLPPPRPHFFFAPDVARSLIKTWGQDRFETAYKSGWQDFARAAGTLFGFEERTGAGGALETYRQLVAGDVAADRALSIRT